MISQEEDTKLKSTVLAQQFLIDGLRPIIEDLEDKVDKYLKQKFNVQRHYEKILHDIWEGEIVIGQLVTVWCAKCKIQIMTTSDFKCCLCSNIYCYQCADEHLSRCSHCITQYCKDHYGEHFRQKHKTNL